MSNLQETSRVDSDYSRREGQALPPRVVGVIGRKQPGEQAALFLHHPHDPYRASFLTPSSRRWAGLGPRDDHPFTCLTRRTAYTVGLTLDALRMGQALLDRAPGILLALWEAEERSTQNAYRLLLLLEEGSAGRSVGKRARA